MILRIIFVILSLLGFFFYSIPFRYGSINAGNALGLLVSTGLLLLGVFLPQIQRLIQSIGKSGGGRICLIGVMLLIALLVGFVLLESGLMVKAAGKAPKENATVLVLGCRVRGEKPTLMLIERMDAAYDYLMEHPEANAVLSGGQGKGEEISEAFCMYRYLTEKGIEGERLYLEDQSMTTEQNLLFSEELIREENLSRNIAIVTNEFHEYRALWIADKLQIEAGAISAKTAWWLFPTYYTRELLAIPHEWLK